MYKINYKIYPLDSKIHLINKIHNKKYINKLQYNINKKLLINYLYIIDEYKEYK